MSIDLRASLLDALRLDSAPRLYRRLQGEGPLVALLGEAWSLREAPSQTWTLALGALSAGARSDARVCNGTRLRKGSRRVAWLPDALE